MNRRRKPTMSKINQPSLRNKWEKKILKNIINQTCMVLDFELNQELQQPGGYVELWLYAFISFLIKLETKWAFGHNNCKISKKVKIVFEN